MTDRCEIVAGDFFETVLSGADACVLKRIVYGWHDDEAVTVLRTVRSVTRPDSRLLMMEPQRRSICRRSAPTRASASRA